MLQERRVQNCIGDARVAVDAGLQQQFRADLTHLLICINKEMHLYLRSMPNLSTHLVSTADRKHLLQDFVICEQGRRDLQTKEALPQGPPKIGGPEILLLLITSVKFQFYY